MYKRQRQIHVRRLHELERRAAIEGIHTPPHVRLEIEDIRVLIETIDQQLGPAALRLSRPPITDFVGRSDEINQLTAWLTQREAPSAVICVRGMGGLGKTELMYATAQRLATNFPDGQILLNLHGANHDPLPPNQALQKVLRAFNRETKFPDDLTELKEIYHATLVNKQCLILADDVHGYEQAHVLIPPRGNALMMTTRSRFTLPGMRALDLGSLPIDAGTELVLAICPRVGGYGPRLASLCGYLPLALRISAGLLANNDTLNIEHYLVRLEAARLVHLRDPDAPDLDVEASLGLSFDMLDASAQSVLCQLSVFPTTFDLPAAMAVVNIDNTEDILGRLRRRCLVEWDIGSERYNLHDLVRAFGLAHLEDRGGAQLRHASYYAGIMADAEASYRHGGKQTVMGLALFDRERLHIDAGWAWSLAHVGTIAGDRLLMAYAEATSYIGHLRYDAGRERIPRLRVALDAAQRHGDVAAESNMLGYLGNAYRAFGAIQEAIELFEQRLVLVRQFKDRHGEGSVLGNLGNAYRNLGDLDRATVLLEDALHIRQEVGDRHAEANTLGSLASVYTARNDLERAIKLNELRLVIVRKIGDQRGEAGVLGHLGEAHTKLGDAHRAILLLEEALGLARALGDQRGEAEWLYHMGSAYMELDDMEQANRYYVEYFQIMQFLGLRPKAVTALQKPIALYEQQGNLGYATRLRRHITE